jgi:hypothetical protein
MVATRQRQSFDRKMLRAAFQLLKALAIGLAVGIAWLNIQPYVQLMLWLSPSKHSATIQFLVGVPIVGWLITQAGWLIAIVGAVIVWAVIQMIELLPDLLKNDRENLKYTINSYRQQNSGTSIESNDDEPEVIRRLIKFYNDLPTKWLKAVFQSQSVAFVADFVLSVLYYPPLLKGVDPQLFIANPNTSDVNWTNAGIIVLCVFTANILLFIMTMVEQGSGYVREESSRG